MSGNSIPLDVVGGALVACTRDGAILGASPAAGELLIRIGGTPDRVPARLWELVGRAPVGETVIWSSTVTTGCILGCTQHSVGDDRVLLVLREITLQQELLAQELQRHRAKNVEMLVFLLAHDLRAPLASIALHLDALQDRFEPSEDTFVRESLEEAMLAASQLRDTIDALVDLVRIGPVRAAELRLVDAIERAVAHTRPLFRHSGHQLELRIDPAAPTLRGNGLAVQHIVMNLLVSLLELTTQPLTVYLATEAAVLESAQVLAPAVRIRVHVDGPGISPAVRAQLAQPLFTTRPSGTSLGLALARDAAMSEQGILQLVPVDSGVCFEVVLPGERSDSVVP